MAPHPNDLTASTIPTNTVSTISGSNEQKHIQDSLNREIDRQILNAITIGMGRVKKPHKKRAGAWSQKKDRNL